MSLEKGRFKIFNSTVELEGIFLEKSIRKLRIGERKVCIAQVNKEFFAFEALCPHQKQPLAEASINGFGEIICPLHFYRFNLKTGQEASRLCRDLVTFPIEQTDDGVFIQLH